MKRRESRMPSGLAWSNTRITVLEYCEKKYFFTYYPYALKPVDQELRLEALLLKNLKSMEMWVGEKTHHLLSDYLHLLKKGEVSDEQIKEIKDAMAQTMREEFQKSKERDYTAGYDPQNKFGFSEHYYGMEVDGQLDPMIEKVWKNLDAFVESEWKEKVVYYFNTAKSVYVENPREAQYDQMKVLVRDVPELEDILILAAPDFGAVISDEKYMILDWKSGKEGFDHFGISDQLKVYALKMLLKKKTIDLEDVGIEGYEVYFPSMHGYGGKMTQEDIDGILQKIIKDVQFQKKFLIDENVRRNEALPHTVFRRCGSPKKCETCTFRSVCDKLKAVE